jgi:heme/copper-type cytochrome/quinol oxidase subunit 1
MLLLHRMFIRLALVFLLAGIGLGSLMQARKGLGLAPLPYAAVTVHNHLLTVGFMLNMVMGVAHWMFPRLPGATAVKAARDPLAWANLACLNVGLLLRAASEPWDGHGWPAGLLVSAVLQPAGILLFVVAIWSRVRFPTPRTEPYR